MSDTTNIGGLECTVINAAVSNPQAAVLLCHGFGAPGTDLVPVAQEMIGARPILQQTVFIFPEAPIELDPDFDSRAWWMIDIEKIQQLMMTGEFRELRGSAPPTLAERRREIFSVLDHIKTHFDLPAERILVGGFSQGAMLATDVALLYPEPLGGLIVWSGTLMNESAWVRAARDRSNLTVVQSHGMTDPILPFAGAELLRDMLVAHGHQVNFVPFGGGHTIGGEALLAAIELLESVLPGN